ncbi:energy-coupling factor transporter transmembrane protein EcfT [Saccharibacillus qingshengii]|uniref:energy-coupling factor transporter transmembrane protein EcfT n=1 Tax=Saccharibacillus qingshengii TaxID=1763540 RepID=UPI00155762B0
MANRLLIGQFVEADSMLHRLDPRTKLLGMLIMMIVLLNIRSWGSYGAAALLVLSVMLLSLVPLSRYLRGLLPILPVLLVTLLYHVLLGRGDDVLASYGVIRITREGIQEGLRIFVRILLLILLASVLTGTTRPLILAQGLERLLKPLSKLRVPVEQFSLMIVIAIRFIPTVLEEVERIQLARRARGFDPTAMNPIRRLFAFVPVLVPLLVTTVRRADNLTMAIDARAYGDGRGRTVYRPLAPGGEDAAAAAAAVLAAALILAIDVLFGS